MTVTSLGNAVVFLFLLGSGFPTPIIEYDKASRYEEYHVNHEISFMGARNSALTTDLESVVAPPGCQKCTYEEKRYCLGSDFVNDHCCCDTKYEVLPYVPHTCYVGDQVCSTVMNGCEQYSRLRTCCCDRFVLEKWKDKFKNSSHDVTRGIPLTIILSQIVYMIVNYFITNYIF